ncbi:hypothetical protein [Zhongshania aliphaticivorans]|nr:hypothetical protein [Zhongshania aliphaticivorans]
MQYHPLKTGSLVKIIEAMESSMPKLRIFFSERLRWEAYRDFFQIQFLRYLVVWFSLVPAAAAILKDVPKTITLNATHPPIIIALELPFSWQALWFSSVFFMAALILYLLFCPKFIKKYHSYSDYQKYEHDGRWITREAARFLRSAESPQRQKFIDRLLIKGLITRNDKIVPPADLYKPEVEKLQTMIVMESKTSQYCLRTPVLVNDKEKHSDAEAGIFWEVYALESDSGFYLRLAISILLTLSGLTFLLVLAQHIIEGARYALT